MSRAEIAARNGKAAFTPIDRANYEGGRSYFVHGKRRDGMVSQYGETLRIAVTSMIEQGGAFDPAGYQIAYLGAFGPGGTYQGYIDRPTRGTIDNIQSETLDPSGKRSIVTAV